MHSGCIQGGDDADQAVEIGQRRDTLAACRQCGEETVLGTGYRY